MTDDLTRGFEGQDDTSAESAENTYVTGNEGSTAVVGQAAAPVNVSRPAPGQTVEIQTTAGQTYNLDFAPGGAQVQVDGANFILAFDDDGDGTPDSQIIFLDMVTVVEGGDAPTFTVAGTEVGADVLLSQALALAGTDDANLETAAGPGAQGGGATEYNDDLGDIIDLLLAQGVIDPTLLEFNLIDIEPDIIELALELEDEFAPPPLLINEIGVSVALEIPSLPGSDEPSDTLPGGEGISDELSPSFDEVDVKEKEPEEYNFIELLNNSDDALSTEDLTVEILNPDGAVVTFAIPDGITIPAGGFIVFYQLADDLVDDGVGVETIVARIFDSEGNVVGGFDIDGATFWNLGDDTTDPIAVNVVFRDGEDVDGDQSVDTFAANTTQDDLGGLTNPDFAGAPAGFGSPLLDLNFETFNGQFTGNHHIFSRVDSDDTNSQSDWTTNNVPTDGTLNDTDLSSTKAYIIGNDKALYELDLVTGVKTEVGELTFNGETLSGDFEGMTFGQGEDSCHLFIYDDENNRILKVDPETAKVLEMWDEDGGVSPDENGLTVGADGTFYVLGDDEGLYSITFNNDGTFELTAVPGIDTTEAGLGVDLSSLAADPNDANVLYAMGEDGANVKLVRITLAPPLVEILPGDIDATVSEEEFGLAFDAFGRLWGISEIDGLAFQIDVTTGETIEGTEIPLGSLDFEALAIPTDVLDRNPWDPLNDDLNPGQNNDDPLAGQNYLQAGAGGEQLEGNGGPDVLLGAEGNDALYGGSQALVDEQADKVLQQYKELTGGDGGEGQTSEEPEGAAGLTQKPLFNDHNDFLFGAAGDDEMYGGAGGDFMIGGQGDDSMDGGTGDDQIYGDGAGDIDGDGSLGTDGLPDDDQDHAGNDVIAGDALNNVKDLGDGGPTFKDEFKGPELDAIAILGGNDTIDAGNGNDKVSGDALATGEFSARAFAYSDDSYKRPEDGVKQEDGSFREDTGFANDIIYGGEGNDSIGGDATAIADGGEGFSANAFAESVNLAIYGASDAPVGDDYIEGNDGDDVIGGDALAVADGGEGVGYAYARSENEAGDGDYDGGEGASAGNDTIYGDGGEGGLGDGGSDVIGGDAAAVAAGGERGLAEARTENTVGDGGEGIADSGTAGSDIIDAGQGNNLVAGDSLAKADGAEGFTDNSAYGDGAVAGDDDIYTGNGDDSVSGGSLAYGENYAYAETNNDALYGGSAGNDHIVSDGGEGQGGDDLVAGEALAISTGKFGSAEAYGDNNVDEQGAQAGNDTITSGSGSDTVSGGALASAVGSAYADQSNRADDESTAGNDLISTNVGSNGDEVAGDAMARSESAQADAVADNWARDKTSAAGNDTIKAGEGNNAVAGDAMAVSDEDDATATVTNTARRGASAGDDSIIAGAGDDIISGGSQARAAGDAEARTTNLAIDDDSFAGNDYIQADGGENQVAGDAQAISDNTASAYGENTAGNGGSDDDNTAGNDTIRSGDANDSVSGGAQAIAGNTAYAEQVNKAGAGDRDDDNKAGNDDIDAMGGDNVIAGDAQALGSAAGATATAVSENTADSDEGNEAGNDTIRSGDDNDTVSGDAQAKSDDDAVATSTNTATYTGNSAGNDDIDVGEGLNQVAGDAQAISLSGNATATGTNEADGAGNSAGNDTIVAGDDNDSISGGAQAVASATATATNTNLAFDGGVAGDDDITSDGDASGDDVVAGDAQAISTGGGKATSQATNGNDSVVGSVGNDIISTGGFDNANGQGDLVAGDSMAVSTEDGGTADAYGDNTAWNATTAGNDSITAGEGNDTISGGALATAAAAALAVQTNLAEFGGSAGNDTINADSGTGG
ncbi:hypothetical protein HBA54_28330, partial [Pelagibius litoralis]